MIKKDYGQLEFFFFKNLSKYKEILHFISTKTSGNLALHVKDDPRKVLKDRRALFSALKIPLDNFVFMNQVHGKNIKEITEKDKGAGVTDYESSIKKTDATITNIPNICLTVLVADCVPILIFDPIKKVIAVVHAGRKGTELKICQRVIGEMREKFGANPKDLIVGLGPSIGPCHYKINLWEGNKKQLIESGVIDSNIEVSEICTYCCYEEFFSARKEKEKSGRFAAGIMIK